LFACAGQSFSSLKEELLFRHSLFPLPPYPPPLSLSAANDFRLLRHHQPQDGGGRAPSLTPDSKGETTGESGGSPGRAETLSDSNSEKRRSRKQKPRRVVQWTEEDEEDEEEVLEDEEEEEMMGEEGGSPPPRGEYSAGPQPAESSPKRRGGGGRPRLPMQSEPEDLTMRVKSELDALQEAYRGAAVSEFSFNAYRRESSASEEAVAAGRRHIKPEMPAGDEVRHRRSEGEGEPSDGSSQPSSPPLPLHRSTPASASSATLKDKLHSSDDLVTSGGGRGSGSHDDDLHDEDDEEDDDDDRGVSPPLMGGGGGGNSGSSNNNSGLADSVSSHLHHHHGNNGHLHHHHHHLHHQLYNPLFAAGGPAGFQLGLAGAAMPLVGLVPGGGRGRYNGVESEPERLSSLVASQKEISQQ
jgi:hypothetical protein